MADLDPVSTAQQLAQIYVAGRRSSVETQTKNTQAELTALDQLQSALRTFDTALGALSAKKGVISKAVALSSGANATASATGQASTGSYSLFIEKIATVQQTSYEFPVPVPASGGALAINLADGSNFSVDLAAADTNGDNKLTPAEVALAINQAAGNSGKVTGMVMTVGGVSQLVMTSAATGTAAGFTVSANAATDPTLKAKLLVGKPISVADDALVWLGPKGTGVSMKQASNTFTAIDGVTLQLQHAMAASDAPLVVTVSDDQSATNANVQALVDAYNTLVKKIDDLSRPGDPVSGKAGGALAMDAGVRALRRQLDGILRSPVGGATLIDFGVTATREGTLKLDTGRLQKRLAADPQALDTLFGSTGLTTSSGVLGAFDKYLDSWTGASSGHVGRRRTGLQAVQHRLAADSARIDRVYDTAYQRYLKQFSALQSLQSQMSQTTGLLASLSPANAG